MEKYENMDCEYGNIERILNDKFKVHHLHRDYRGDDGDDGGYVVAITENEKKEFFLVVTFANYNCPLKCLVFTEEDYYPEDDGTATREFIPVDSIEDAQVKLNAIVVLLETIMKYDLEDYEANYAELLDSVDLDRSIPDNFITHDINDMLNVMIFSYSEYNTVESVKLNMLSKTEYTPDFTNPMDD